METVVVIGSNSFSGAWFCQYLLHQDVNVIGISRSAQPIDALLPHTWVDGKHITFHQLDLNHQLDEIFTLLAQVKPQKIINFAAQSMVGQSWHTPEDWFATNCVATSKLMNWLRGQDWLDRYVHISTPEVYGSCEGYVTEHRNYHPSTPYAISRAASDMMLHAFHDVYDFPVVFTRAANVYGPGQQLYRIIPKAILCALTHQTLPLHGGGHSERSFIHMQDVSSATWLIANEGQLGDIYHIATKNSISIRQLVETICELMQVPFEALCEVTGDRLGKDKAYLLASDKLRDTLGWTDSIQLKQGLAETIHWATKNLSALKSQPFDYVHKA